MSDNEIFNKGKRWIKRLKYRITSKKPFIAFLLNPTTITVFLLTLLAILFISAFSTLGSPNFETQCSILKAPIFSTSSTKEDKEAYLFSYFSSFIYNKKIAGETTAYVMDRTGNNMFSSNGMFPYSSETINLMKDQAKKEEINNWYNRSDIQLSVARDLITSGEAPENLLEVVQKINPKITSVGNFNSESERIAEDYKDFDSECKFYGQGGGSISGQSETLDLSDAVKLALQLSPFDWGIRIGTIPKRQSDFQRTHPEYDYIPGDMDGIKLGKITHPQFSELRNKIIDEKGGSDRKLADCGKFVTTIVIASKMDEDFPRAHVETINAYILKHPEKWKKVPMSERQPGDVMIQGDNAHIVFYLGKIDGQDAVTQASWDEYLPMKSKHSTSWFETYYGKKGYKFYRPVKAPAPIESAP